MLQDQQEDYLAEYDHFTTQRKAHLDKNLEVKRIQDGIRRKAKKDAALAWRGVGQKALSQVQSKLEDIKLKLQPYHYYRQTMDLLLQYHDDSLALDSTLFICRTRSSKILHIIRQVANRRKFTVQTNLILWKFVLLRDLLEHFRRRNPYKAQFWFLAPPRPLTVIRRLFRYFMQFIPVEKAVRMQLYKKRDVFRKAKAKEQLIHRTQAACAAIPLCRSIQHYNIKGCSNCGVIFMGGTLSGAVPYVKSVGRDTGAPTLVTLDFEIETLLQEDEVQQGIVKQASDDLQVFEDVVFMLVRLALQRWWATVLVFKRLAKQHRTLLRSLHRHRRRRLIVMKNEMHMRIKEPKQLLFVDYYDKYCDIPCALAEQVDALNSRKQQRMLKYAQAFRNNLHALVAESRERKHREWLRLQSLPPPVKPIVIKTLPSVKLGYKLMCYRPGCNLRKFLTKERFDIHMAVHAKEDAGRYEAMAQKAVMKGVRAEAEQRFLGVLAEYRESTDVSPVYEESNALVAVLDDDAVAPRPWLELPHRYQLTKLFNAGSYFLELVSRAVGVIAPNTVPLLPNALTRIGRRADNDCVIAADSSGAGREVLDRVDAIHCTIHHECNEGQSVLYIVDNLTLWGTYTLSESSTASKVPSRGRSKASYLANGTLICIAAKAKGESHLSAVTASAACVVYRLQCKGM